MEGNIIQNIRKLSSYIDDAYLTNDEDKFFFYQSHFKTFHQQLIGLFNNWFPKSKPINLEQASNIIYLTDEEISDYKIWVKYSLDILIKSSERVFANTKKYYDENNKHYFEVELYLLREISFEASMFLEDAYRIVENKEIKFGQYKRFSIHPRETISASAQILRKTIIHKSIGDFVFSPTSIFLIRQSIELWIKDIFGIDYIVDDKDELIKLQPERLFELLNNKIELPINKKVIFKIHKWSQRYVHAGWMVHIWEIENALHILNPIFNSRNIKIKKSYYDDMENQLIRILNMPNIKLFRSNNYSSTIIEDK